MVERKSYPAGVPCWVDIAHGDVQGAVTFYAGLFDWQISDATPPGSPGRYYVARCGGSAVAGIAPLAENAPGAWNWSDLNANDLAGARAFYAAVFGWETTPVDFGSGESFMVRRPGYSDFLEQIDPGVRQRHLGAGAPEGFTDAIAWMQPLSPAEREPRWAV